MARPCTICRHPDRDAIDRAIIAQDPYPDIARRYAVSPDALGRHKANELQEILDLKLPSFDNELPIDLFAQISHLQRKVLLILEKAEQAEDYKVMLSAVKEARGNLELLARLTGQIGREDRPESKVEVNLNFIEGVPDEVKRFIVVYGRMPAPGELGLLPGPTGLEPAIDVQAEVADGEQKPR